MTHPYELVMPVQSEQLVNQCGLSPSSYQGLRALVFFQVAFEMSYLILGHKKIKET